MLHAYLSGTYALKLWKQKEKKEKKEEKMQKLMPFQKMGIQKIIQWDKGQTVTI